MAGDWMQIDLDLLDKPEVLRLSAETGMGTMAVVGRLVALWRWIERQGVDGLIRHATPSVVCSVVDAEAKFVDILVDVKWLAFDANGAVVPGWEKRFSKAAKQRMEDAKRKSTGRKSDARPEIPDRCPENTGARGEEEERKSTSLPPIGRPTDENLVVEAIRIAKKIAPERQKLGDRDRETTLRAAYASLAMLPAGTVDRIIAGALDKKQRDHTTKVFAYLQSGCKTALTEAGYDAHHVWRALDVSPRGHPALTH